MYISELFDIDEFQDMVERGYVNVQRHPTKPFNIACYTNQTQFESRWNKVTETCRGLIYDDNGVVVARPWAKFHNLGQVNLPTDFFNGKVEITDKMDGSLGILYWDGEDWAISTKGSFASDQAKHATELFRREYGPYIDGISTAFNTYLFEIVYKSNRIVLDYGDMDDLVLLGAVDIEQGYYYGPGAASAMLDWGGPVVSTFDYDNVSDMLGHMNRPNAEGYVIRRGNFLVKAKQPDYVEMHRVVTNLSEKKVWEAFKNNKFHELLDIVPDEWHEWLMEVRNRIGYEILDLRIKITDEWVMVMSKFDGKPTRKEFALAVKDNPYKSYLFMMFDDRDVDGVLYDAVKPTGQSTQSLSDGDASDD